jgi:hypothetical protein
MTETYDQVITSEEQAASVKAALTAGIDVSLFTPAWRTYRFATPALAVFYANEPPAQKEGEAVFSVGADGVVYAFLFIRVP